MGREGIGVGLGWDCLYVGLGLGSNKEGRAGSLNELGYCVGYWTANAGWCD